MSWRHALAHVALLAVIALRIEAQSCPIGDATLRPVHYLQQTADTSDARCNAALGLKPDKQPCRIDLQGVLYEPRGGGDHPVIVFNHGSERMRTASPSHDKCALAQFFVRRGFIVFVPYRRGHGTSTGVYVGEALRSLTGPAGERSAAVGPLLSAQADDVKAAVDYVRDQVPHVAKHKIAVVGHSYGGIVTLCAAARAGGVAAAVDFSGAALSWKTNLPLHDFLRDTVKRARVPIFFLQPGDDCNTQPTEVLAPLGPVGSRQRVDRTWHAPLYEHIQCRVAHNEYVYGEKGQAAWGKDVLAFLAAHGVTP